MTRRLFCKRLLSMFMALVIVFGMFPALGTTAFAADETTASDIATAYPSGVAYSVTARVDESVGLRGTVTITPAGGNAITGISPLDVKIRDGQQVTGDTMQVAVQAAEKYRFTGGKIVALAQVEHKDKTVDAYQHVTEFTGASTTYTIPKFGAYTESGDTVTVEITAYADFTYQEPQADITVNVSDGSITGNDTSGVTKSGDTIRIDPAALNGKVVKITGEMIGTSSNQVIITSSAKGVEASRRADIILDDVLMLPVTGTTKENYKTHLRSSPASRVSVFVAAAGNTNRQSSSFKTVSAPIAIADADVHMTLTGSNILSNNSSYYDSGSVNQSAIMVDATASLVITDKSTGNLFAQGGGCSAAIGSSGTQPSGFVEIDGGTIQAYSAFSQHSYAGIGNGGHYTSTDPGTRGFVMNGGDVEAIGFHYGIGGNGGQNMTSGSYDSDVGRQYINVTGGTLLSEASAGSQGATLGWAYNNDEHVVRIGRIGDNDSDLSVTAVNWGYGAAISGRMNFYSGTTAAYSGEYAAAIGGNGLSNAVVANPSETNAQQGTSAITGTQLCVYGGNITAVAGAFEQEGYGTSPSTWRGISGNRSDSNAINTIPILKGEVGYGAAIGGANTKSGGSATYLFGGAMDVQSSLYGAGIGGGGGYGSNAAGGGGTTRFGSLTDLSSANAKAVDMKVKVNSSVYGAGIGGGGSQSGSGGDGGDGLYISTKTTPPSVGANTFSFEINSGKYGAGIGGGGSQSGAGGSGAKELTIDGGNFSIVSGGTTSDNANYGAGIGGGGSESGAAGNGPTTARLNGGYFTINSKGYGSAIGGGGTNTGTAGGCGTVYVTGGTITATNSSGNIQLRGLGGGAAASASGTSRVEDGNVIIIGGNVYTDAGTEIPNSNNGQYVWTRPNNANLPSASNSYTDPDNWDGTVPTITGTQDQLSQTTTGRYQEITGIPATRIGQQVYQIQYSFPAANGTTGSFFDYGTEDTFVTKGEDGNGAMAVWVPSGYRLTYDLNPQAGQTVTEQNGYQVGDSSEWASGTIALIFPEDQGKPSYVSKGQTVYLVQQDTRITEELTLGNDPNKPISGIYQGKSYATGGGTIYRSLLEHPDVVKENDCGSVGTGKVSTPVVFAGWSAEKEERIFDVHQGYYPKFIDSVDFTTADQTVYAVWGYDENGNGIADIVEQNLEMRYDANGGIGAPTKVEQGIPGATYTIDSKEPTHDDYIFVGWSLTRPNSAVTATNKDDTGMANAGDNYKDILADLYIYNGQKSFGSGGVVTGKKTIEQQTGNMTLYAVWAADSNSNNVPDFLESLYTITFTNALSGLTGVTMPAKVENLLQYDKVNVGGTAPSGTATANGVSMLFGGWTTDRTFAEKSYGYPDQTGGISRAELEKKLVSEVVIGTADVALYPVWLEDKGGDGTPDIDQSGEKLTYQDTAGLVSAADLPEDTNLYYAGVTLAGAKPKLQYGEAVMKASGYMFMGWTTDASKGIKYESTDKALYEANFATVNDAPTEPTDLYNKSWNGEDITFPTGGSLYAVWAADSNNDGSPDWDATDSDKGLRVYYNSGLKQLQLAGAELDQESMPFKDKKLQQTGPSGVEELTTYDDNTGAGYNTGDTVALDPTVPVVTPSGKQYVFLGWSPLFWEQTIFNKDDFGAFKNHLDLIYDIKKGQNVSGKNEFGNTGKPYISEKDAGTTLGGPVSTRSTFYSLKGGDVRQTALISDWSAYAGEGLLESVTQASIDWKNNTASKNDGTYETTSWTVYPLWGIDENGNGLPDMFETRYNLHYEGNGTGVLNVPYDEAWLPGQNAMLKDERDGVKISRNDAAVSPNPLVFIGWTTEPPESKGGSLKDHYEESDKAALQQVALIDNVTFGGFDITVYAVWGVDADGNGKPDVKEDEYTLHYMANTNRISADGSPAFKSEKHQYQDVVTLDYTNKPTDGNYIFLYWTEETGNNLGYIWKGSDDLADLPDKCEQVTFNSGDISVYAVWGEDTDNNGIPDIYEKDYHLYYDANGGSNPPVDNTNYKWGDTAYLNTVAAGMTPPQPDYVLIGWTTADKSSYPSVYKGGDTTPLPTLLLQVKFETKDITVNAVWGEDSNGNGAPDIQEGKYKLAFDLNGGTDPDGTNFGSQFLNEKVQISLPAASPVKAGETFQGWSDGASIYQPGDRFTMPAKNVTLVAQWSGTTPPVTQHTVSYDGNGGSGSMTDPNSPYNDGDTVTVLASSFTAPAGKMFTGWNTQADGMGAPYAAGDTFVIRANTTLYAQWDSATVNLMYDVNGGTASSGTTVADPGNPHNNGASITVMDINDPALGFTASAGKKFLHWNTRADGTGLIYLPNETFVLTADTTLYAQWKDYDGVTETWRVSYDGNGAISGSTVDPQAYHTGDNATVQKSGFTAPAGSVFDCWNTKRDGSGTDYAPEDTISNISSDIVLYAQWKQAVRVTYHANGGSGSMADPNSPYAVGAAVKVLANGFTAPSGKKFDRWNTKPDGTGTSYAAGAVFTIAADTDLYARWKTDSSSGGSGGSSGGGSSSGGGGGGGGSVTKYPINVRPSGDGSASSNKDEAAAGEKVTITTDGTVEKITVTDENGKQVTVTDKGNGEYTFTMPSAGVTVNVKFEDKEDPTMPEITDPNETGISAVLNTKDHMAYMQGDPAGTFRPSSNITRAEVATIFYRLLLDKNVEQQGRFTDVASGQWYHDAIATLAGKGIINGYNDGTFRPNNAITRAEFAAIATRFAKANNSGSLSFSDVSASAWYYKSVLTAVNYGWINGYSDGTFRPDQPILRAEAAKIVNYMLGRIADRSAVDSGAGRNFPDVTKSHWAFYEIAEATTEHEYTRESNTVEENWK